MSALQSTTINNKKIIAASVLALAMGNAYANSVLDKTTVSFGGYIKADAIWSDYSDGDLPSGSIGRDFYIPSLTPVGQEDEGDSAFDMHARQTRFNFGTETKLANGKVVTGKLELDFMVTPNGDERISNSYTPRIRHAFFKYDGWLIGQTWTNFQDTGALPETLDFVGVTEGTVFERQTMIKYTTGAWSFSAENPETTVTPFGGGGRIVADDNDLPDATMKYTYKADWGYITAAAIVRELSYVDNATDIDESEIGGGVSFTSKINFGRDDLRLMLNAGTGLGRYVGLNVSNDVVINDKNELETIDTYGGAIAYRHWWNEEWRSSFTYSFIDIDNDTEFTGNGVTDKTHSARVNLLYSPSPELMFGTELAYAERDIETGDSGDMTRIQFSAKYAF